MRSRNSRAALVASATGLALGLSACAGWGGGGIGGGGADSINVLMVNNPQMVDLQQLTADHFTKETGIRVNYTVLPENDVRDKISQEFSSQAGQYDVASLSNFEIPIYAKAKWIAPLDDYIANDTRVRPGRHPQVDDDLAVERGQGLRRAVLRRVLLPDVPQGRPGEGQGRDDAGRSRPGRRSRTSRPRSTAPSPA